MMRILIISFYIIFLFQANVRANETILSCINKNTDYSEYKKRIFDNHKSSAYKMTEQEFQRTYTQTLTITPDKKLLFSRKGKIEGQQRYPLYETEKYLIFTIFMRTPSGALKPYVQQFVIIDRINLKYVLQNFYQSESNAKNRGPQELVSIADEAMISFLKFGIVPEGSGGSCVIEEVKKKKL